MIPYRSWGDPIEPITAPIGLSRAPIATEGPYGAPYSTQYSPYRAPYSGSYSSP